MESGSSQSCHYLSSDERASDMPQSYWANEVNKQAF